MNRRTLMALLGLAIVFATALPQIGFAQSVPLNLVGTWKLNLAKSTYSPGPPPRSATLTNQAEGEGIRTTFEVIDAQGNPAKAVIVAFYDGMPHPSTGSQTTDASAYTRVDANTVIFNRLKTGKLVATGTGVVTQDGKTLTVTTTGTNGNSILVYDKQ